MRMTKMRMRMARQSFVRKHLRNFCSIAVASIIILCVGNLVDAYAYTTTDSVDLSLGDNAYTVLKLTGATNWEECETECRNHVECQLFGFEGSSTYLNPVYSCYLFRSRLGYGALIGDGRITGQLESTNANATLSWLGIGEALPQQIGPELIPTTVITHTMCQAHCDAAVNADNVTCAQYTIETDVIVNRCRIFSNIITDLPTGPATASVGVRDGLPTDGLTIQNDPMNTRVAVADFPPAPPDIGTAIPAYTEINYHYTWGLELFFPFVKIPVANVSWEDCAVECHRDSRCLSFVAKIDYTLSYKVTECRLYDLAIFGRVRPTWYSESSKYGVIDRSGAEGDVLSVVDCQSGLSGYVIVKMMNVTSMDECAKRCYDFYRPKLCIGFFHSTITQQVA